MPGRRLPTIRTFQTADADPLAALLRNSLAAGELNGFTSGEIEGLIGAFPIVRNLLVAEIEGRPVGIICSDQRLLAVDPSARRRGIGRALVDAMEVALEATPDGPLILYPPDGSETALAFLAAVDFAYDHTLWGLRLDTSQVIEQSSLPSGIDVEHFADRNIDAYIEVINTAFRDHPVPLRVTREQIEHVHAKPSFDPGAIAILRNGDGGMIGFCTTGIDPESDPPHGFINLLGLLPDYRRRGLGRWLLQWGIERLRAKGVKTVELGVEAANARAVELYRSVGFELAEEWPQWMRTDQLPK